MKAISGYMFLVAMLLGIFRVVLSLIYVFTGQVPTMVAAAGGKTNLIALLDLSLVVSFGLLGAIWLRRRRSWVYVLATMWNIKGAVYMAALSAASVSAKRSGASDNVSQVALWGSIGAGCLLAAAALLRNCHSQPSH